MAAPVSGQLHAMRADGLVECTDGSFILENGDGHGKLKHYPGFRTVRVKSKRDPTRSKIHYRPLSSAQYHSGPGPIKDKRAKSRSKSPYGSEQRPLKSPVAAEISASLVISNAPQSTLHCSVEAPTQSKLQACKGGSTNQRRSSYPRTSYTGKKKSANPRVKSAPYSKNSNSSSPTKAKKPAAVNSDSHSEKKCGETSATTFGGSTAFLPLYMSPEEAEEAGIPDRFITMNHFESLATVIPAAKLHGNIEWRLLPPRADMRSIAATVNAGLGVLTFWESPRNKECNERGGLSLITYKFGGYNPLLLWFSVQLDPDYGYILGLISRLCRFNFNKWECIGDPEYTTLTEEKSHIFSGVVPHSMLPGDPTKKYCANILDMHYAFRPKVDQSMTRSAQIARRKESSATV